LVGLADRLGLPVVATGNVHYVERKQREVQDLLTATRHRLPLDAVEDVLYPNAEYGFCSPAAMQRRLPDVPGALAASVQLATRCASAATFLPVTHQSLPNAATPHREPAFATLWRLCRRALRQRYPQDPPRQLLHKELDLIAALNLTDYFFIVWDVVRFARAQGIRCQGRGSAANSLVAYLLGITPIDPVATDLVFERFLSRERQGPPDIDLDIAADRREEVIQYVYERYGHEHAAMACTLVTYRARSAVRDTARALGLPPAAVERLADAVDVRDARQVPESATTRETLDRLQSSETARHLLRLVPQLAALPRHLGIHNGGMVLSGPPLHRQIPLEPATMEQRVVTQWDKAALEAAHYIKLDLLGLRMLSALEDAVTIVEGMTGQRPALDALPRDDPIVYAMLSRGASVGVFQVESRAQAQLLPRFRPETFADLVVEISLIRPGPLQAQMVHPYLRRRTGKEPVTYLHPLLKPALAETLGVLVFQEQVLKVAQALAGFTAGEAEQLRRALGHKRATEELAQFRARFLAGAANQNVPQPIARKIFAQLQAFGGYAFPKSHAAAFAVLTYQSAWLRRYHPAAFFAALLRHQPMGFYPAHVIVAEARRCGVEIRTVDVQRSAVQATVEDAAIRLGLVAVRGLGETRAQQIITVRAQDGPFGSLADFCRRTHLSRRPVEALILGGACDGWGRPRRRLLWELEGALQQAQGPPRLLGNTHLEPPALPDLSADERLMAEQAHTGRTAAQHLTAVIAQVLREMGVTPVAKLAELEPGTRVRVGGMVVARQQPPTARGITFLALEDATGIVNVVLKPAVVAKSRKALGAPFVIVEGQVQQRDGALSVLASRVLPVYAPV
jgi:error-prone DNA polymerase